MKILEVSPGVYEVEGDSGNTYIVFYNPRLRRFVCTCPDYVFRLRTCKHCKAVAEFLSRRPLGSNPSGGKGGGGISVRVRKNSRYRAQIS